MNTLSKSANDEQSPFSVANLTKIFDDRRALSGVTLDFPRRGITALLGANGAGKTTLINCALGLCRADAGSISILGGKPGDRAVKQRLGVMLQDADLPDLLTPREHISLFSSYYPNPIVSDRLVELCELSDFADTRYKKLSGGQKRRTQFALAILGQPEIVFLDEPTTGLDTDARRVLWNTIRELDTAGTKIVLTTHYLEEADALADHTVVMHQGSVIANAPTDDIRAAVSGAVIRCTTFLKTDTVAALAGVNSVQEAGRYCEILSTDGTTTLKALFKADPDLGEITVAKPSLEHAFTQLTTKPQRG